MDSSAVTALFVCVVLAKTFTQKNILKTYKNNKKNYIFVEHYVMRLSLL